MFSSLPDRPKLWAPPLASEPEDDNISIVLGDSEWDVDSWPLDIVPRSASNSSTQAYTTTSLPSVATTTSLRTPYASVTPDLPTLPEKPITYAEKVDNGKTPTKASSRVNHAPSSAAHSTNIPSEEAARKSPQHLLALLSSGVRHVAALEVRGQNGLLGGAYIESIVYGDTVILSAGEAALSVHGGRPESATRAIAACPTRYGAPDCLPSAMALAHAHCTLHDLFACDTRLAAADEYYDILRTFVTALTDWPAVATRTSEPVESHVLELLDLPPFSHSSGFSLGLRSQAIEVSLRSGGKIRPTCGTSLVPKMTDKGVVWAASQQTLLEGWFPWLFVEPLGLRDDVAHGYVRLLGAMRTSLAIYARLHNLAKKARPVACTKRTEPTRIAYGLQTIGVLWHVFAMADEGDEFPVTTIWSGRVEEPRHMTQATAILRQIGAEAKSRLRSVRDWLTCICVDYEGVLPSAAIPIAPGTAHLNLPPGIPIPGPTHPIKRPPSSHLTAPSSAAPSPVTQPPTPSWKPWVEPFEPQRTSPAPPSEPSQPPPATAPHAAPPLSTNSGPQGGEHIWAPEPHQLSAPWDSWQGAPPHAYHSTPPPFNYSATYEYAWPLPGASVTARSGVPTASVPSHPASWKAPRSRPPMAFTPMVPMKRPAESPGSGPPANRPYAQGLFSPTNPVIAPPVHPTHPR